MKKKLMMIVTFMGIFTTVQVDGMASMVKGIKAVPNSKEIAYKKISKCIKKTYKTIQRSPLVKDESQSVIDGAYQSFLVLMPEQTPKKLPNKKNQCINAVKFIDIALMHTPATVDPITMSFDKIPKSMIKMNIVSKKDNTAYENFLSSFEDSVDLVSQLRAARALCEYYLVASNS